MAMNLRNLEIFPDKVHNRMMDRKGSCLKKPLAEIAEFQSLYL